MEPSQILQLIINSEYLHYYSDWIQTANEKEGRGLQLMGHIFKNKGRKKFRYTLGTTLIEPNLPAFNFRSSPNNKI